MRRLMLAAALPLTVLLAADAEAQSCGNSGASSATCNVNGSVSTTVPYIVRLSVSDHEANLTAPDENDFELSGTVDLVDEDLQVATVRANAAWTLTLTGAAWGAPWVKPVGDLAFSTDNTSYTAMTTSPQSIGSGGATNGTDITLSYRTSWALTTDVPGAYSMALTFTVAAP